MKKIGIMISAAANSKAFTQGLAATRTALGNPAQVYLYLIDDAVEGLSDAVTFEELKNRGVHLFACAYSIQKRGLNAPGPATLSGLTVLSDIMSSTDEFQSYNDSQPANSN